MSLEKGKLNLDELRRLGLIGPEGASFIPPQTYGDTVDISTPPPSGPFANPAQMMPPPIDTTVPMGNPFQKQFYGSQPAPTQQYMPPEVSRGGGLLGASSRPDQAMTGSQMMTDMASVPDYRSVPTEEPVPLKIQRPSAPQPQRVNSVFGDNIISDVARMAAPLAKKVMAKKDIDPNLNSDGSMQNFSSNQSIEQAAINPMQEGNVFPFSSNGTQSAPSAMPQYTDDQARQAQQLRVASESDKEAENVINKVATDVSGADLVTDVSDVDSGNPLNLINTITPSGDNNIFSKKENAKKLTEEVRKKEAESPGFVKRMMSNPNLFPYLAMAFNTMRLDPDQSLNAAMMKTIESNNELRKANRTAAWFMSQGTPEGKKAAEFIAAGGSAKDAMDMFMPRYSMNTRVVVDKEGNRKLLTVSDKGIPKLIDLPEGYSPQEELKYVDAGTYTSVIDGKTGVELGRIPKNIGEAAVEQAAGKAEGEFTAEQRLRAPQSFAVAKDMVQVIGDFLNHPGFEDVFGYIQGRLPTLLPTATDAEKYLKQIQGKAFLQAFETLKGGGQITEREGIAATQAISRLNSAQSEAAAEEALFELYELAIRAMNKAKDANPDALKDFVIPEFPQKRYSGVDLDGRSTKIEDEIIDAKDLF